MQAIADKLGMELKIEDMAFDSIIPAVSTGKIDVGAAGFTVTEERKKNVNFTDTYATSKQVIIVRDGNAVTAKSSNAISSIFNSIPSLSAIACMISTSIPTISLFS